MKKLIILTTCIIVSVKASVEDLVKAIQAQDQPKIATLIKKDPASINQFYSPIIQTSGLGEAYTILAQSLNTKSQDKTPLFYAVATHNPTIVQQLLNAGANPNTATGYGKTPLHEALAFYQVEPEIVKALIEKGASLTKEDDYGNIPLLQAADNAPHNLFAWILEKKPDLTIKNSAGETALHKVAQSTKNDNLLNAQLLIQKGADVTARNNDNKTPVDVAFEQTIKNYLDNELFKKEYATLSAVINKDNSKALELAQKDPESIIKTNQYGNNALRATLMRDDSEFFTKLFSIINQHSPQKALATLNTGDSLLHEMIERKEWGHANALLDAGINPNVLNKYGNTPLHEATRLNKTELVQKLLEKNADPLIKNHDKQTAFHLAAIKRNDKILKLLATKFPQLIDLKDKEGNTALHLLIMEEAPPKDIRMLLDLGANPAILNNEKKRAQDYVDPNDTEVQTLFTNYSPLHVKIKNLASNLSLVSLSILA